MSRQMKDSGIEWMGKIPENWNIISFWQATERMATGLNPRDNFELTKEDLFYYVTIRNFKDGKLFLDDNCDRISETAWSIIQERSQLKKGDILFASISKDGQAYILEEEATNWNINESVFCIRIDNERYDEKYFYYHLIDDAFYSDLRMDATGSTFQSIKQNKLRKSRMVMPSLEEQKKIATFLESQCAHIDTVIEKTKASIEEYKKLKQAVITQAVTKGVRGDRPMKDSEYEWIATTPKDWTVIKIKWLLDERKERSEAGEEEPLSMSQKYGLIPTKDMDSIPNMASSFVGAKLVYHGDLVFNKLKAHLGVFAVSQYNGLVSPDYAVYYSTGKTQVKFLEYLFKTPQYINEFKKKSSGIGAGLTRLYTDDLYSIYASIPSLEEQDEIIRYIDKKSYEINMLIAKKEKFLLVLESYKKSLIYEYVTGKKEV